MDAVIGRRLLLVAVDALEQLAPDLAFCEVDDRRRPVQAAEVVNGQSEGQQLVSAEADGRRSARCPDRQ